MIKNRDLPEGVPPLALLYLYIAGSCNLACRHCWITPSYQPNGGGQFVQYEHLAKMVRQAKPLGLRRTKLTGGEPTLHPQFRKIVAFIVDEGIDVTMETNGTLVDTDLANFLRQIGGVSFISVSLDGADIATHEKMRQVAGSYQKAINGIRALSEAGLRPQMICTLHRGNLEQMEAVVTLAESLGCGSVKFNHVQQMGRGEQLWHDQGLTTEEVIAIYHRVEKDLSQKAKIPLAFDIPFAFRKINSLLTGPLNTCSVRNTLGLLAGGEISMCGVGVTIPELVYGNIATDNVRDIWVNHPALLALRKTVPFEMEGVCGRCLHRDMCLGVCIASTYHVTGKLNGGYPFCAAALEQGLFPMQRLTDHETTSSVSSDYHSYGGIK